ncbi:uncharacterized protein EAE97_005665 [Botrytis byssoidea]|uniref:Uncharacterized protein n=1 Tax=Botrytis byssoidea TaxID=139641 RepID=A0A9P5IQN2_9HELO|nr:uncharacterized protein EAE97_005665 [Botrytis byssoidea]KAF7943594.1 hypothetical protein EAE97_005665 [Botrytis byssoidea]
MADNRKNNTPDGDQYTSEDQSYQNHGDDQIQEDDNQNLELDMAHTLISPSPASPFRISPAVVSWTQQIRQMQQITQTQMQGGIQIRMLEDHIQQMRTQMQTQQQDIEQIQQALNLRNHHQMRDRASTSIQHPSDLPENSPDSRPSRITNTEDITAGGRTETEKGIDTLESENPPPLPLSSFLLLNGAPHAADGTRYTAEHIMEGPSSIVEQKRAGEEGFGSRTAKRLRHTQAPEDIDTAEAQKEEDTQTENQASLERTHRRQELTLPQPLNADTEEQQTQQVISGNHHLDQVVRQGALVISEGFRDHQPVIPNDPPLIGYLSRYREQERRGPSVSHPSNSDGKSPQCAGLNNHLAGTTGTHGLHKVCLRCGAPDHLSFQKICPQHPRNKK